MRVRNTRERIYLSTRVLEQRPGDMLAHKQRVFDQADVMAAEWRRFSAVRWEEFKQRVFEEEAAARAEESSVRGA